MSGPSLGIHSHYKGQFYDVLGLATSCKKEKNWVFYQLCYGAKEFALRKLEEFTATRLVKGENRSTYTYVPNKDKNTITEADRVMPIDDSVPPTTHPELSAEASKIENDSVYVLNDYIVVVMGVAYAHGAKNTEKVVFKVLSDTQETTLKCMSIKKFSETYTIAKLD